MTSSDHGLLLVLRHRTADSDITKATNEIGCHQTTLPLAHPFGFKSGMRRIPLATTLILTALAVVGLAKEPPATGSFADSVARFERAERHGFRWTAANAFPGAYVGKIGANDDGPYGLPLLGGIGTGAFGRDLHGHFNRWQLQPGFGRLTSVDAASLNLRWEQGGKSGAYRLGDAGWDRPLPKGARSVAVLWPIVSERLRSPDWPVEVVVESWSPVVPHDYEASALPVAFFDVYARNTSSAPARLDLALFMPNFLGWRKGYGNVLATEEEKTPKRVPPKRMGLRGWPERSNSGNYAEPAEADVGRGLRTGVLMRRAGVVKPSQDMEGQLFLGIGGGADVTAQRNVSSFVSAPPVTDDATAAACILRNVEQKFFSTGRLTPQEKGWRAADNEVLASAVGGGLTLAPGGEGHFTIVVVWDLPLVQFGSGRTWEKSYAAKYGADGQQARRIAIDALARRADWRRQLERWHQATLGEGADDALARRGAAINDLYYVVGGGTAWVAREHPRAGLEAPSLGGDEHFSILEGSDTGYYFTTTLDLWPYAQPALEANWPRLSDLVLQDFLRSAPLAYDEPRFITGQGYFTVRKPANKLPHDLGSPAGDPWHRINEYGSTRDTNGWKDHNPEFILSLYLNRRSKGKTVTDQEWRTLLGVAEFMIAQDTQKDGLPFHDAQGDSTWDALHFTGPSPYSGALTLGAWAAMAEWARQRGDDAQAKRFGDRLALAQASFEKHFWNGRYYRAAANGDQAEWVLSDALFGVLMAETAGLRGLLPADHVTAHLRRVADRNWREFGKGEFGPALLAPPEGPIPTDRLQVGEVIVGSARSTAALMQRFGLREEGGAMADAVNRTLYQRSGLQFRTPAALGAGGTFRAPSNLRPLASWYSLWPERQ